MKILIVTNSFPPAIGGAEIACERIAKILSKKYAVTVITKKDGLIRKKSNKIKIIELEAKTIYSYMPKLKEKLTTENYDLYVSFGFGKYFFDFLGKWCKKNKKKCISIPIGYFHTKNSLLFKEVYRNLFAKKSLNNYDLLITATQQEKEFWNEEFKIDKEKIKVIPHTLEKGYTIFNKTQILEKHKLKSKKYILYLGRYAKNKRPDLLITAFNKIKTDLDLVIAGKGTNNKNLMCFANKKVKFVGEIDENEKKELIKNAKFCVFPSEYETYGMLILEAIKFKTPIIASNIPVFREIIDDEAYLFENNSNSLNEKLIKFIDNPKLFKSKKINQEKEYLNTIKEVIENNKKIKISMQYPWIVADSPYYKYLFDYPPKNANYLNPVIKSRDVIINKNKLQKANKIKDIIRKTAITKDLPIPNVRINFGKNCDLIHSAHCVTITNKPWVVDFEGAWQIVVGRTGNKISEGISKEILKRNNCKKIICWTKDTKENLLKMTNDKNVSNKTIIVYPAVPIQKKVKNNKKINLLFVGRYFKEKGGDCAVKVMDNLSKKYKNVSGTIISQELDSESLSIIKHNKKIKFFSLMPRQELFAKIFPSASIFIYPGFSDTFGFGFLEAMSFGLPIITVDGIARKEIVENNKNGFLIERENLGELTDKEKLILTEKMLKKTEILIKNKNLRKKMGDYGYNLVKTGRFSIKERNTKLEKIYSDAIKN